MPILVRDPWRKHYFDGLDCPDNLIIPVDDTDAWLLYPGARKIYDRLFVAQAQGLPAAPHGTEPPFFPIFSKPIMNLKGMGIGSRIIGTYEEYVHSYEAGHFWMPVLYGEHISSDCAVIDGKIHWMRHATGSPFRDGMFSYWTIHIGRDPNLGEKFQNFVADHLGTYSGMVNFETIGGTIIEAHLRFADQWCDLYGRDWIRAFVRLYRDHIWSYDDADARVGFSVPLFADERGQYDYPPINVQNEILAMPDVSSLQITFDADKASADHARPPGGMRLALVNGWNLAACLRAINRIASCYPASKLIRPFPKSGLLSGNVC